MGCLGISLLLVITLWVLWVSTVMGCSQDNYAIYHLTFEGLWTKDRFPKVFPESRPKAQWSPLIGRIHSSNYSLFEVSKLMSDKLKPFVEFGHTTALAAEGQGQGVIFDTFSGPPLSDGQGLSESTVIASADKNKMSVVVKIVPSPDWFVGVDSFPLCQNGEWLKSHEMSLWPLDGGTQRGYTFSSPRWKTDPIEEITEITSLYPNHTAGAFYYPELSSLPPIATISIKLVRVLTVKNEWPSKDLNGAQILSTDPQLNLAKADNRINAILKPPIPTLMKSGAAIRTVFAMKDKMALNLARITTEPTATPEPITSTITTEPTTVESHSFSTGVVQLANSKSSVSSTDRLSYIYISAATSVTDQTRKQSAEQTAKSVELVSTSESILDHSHTDSTTDSMLTTVSELWTSFTNYITATEKIPLHATTQLNPAVFIDMDDEEVDSSLRNVLDSSSGWLDDSDGIENNVPTDKLSLVTNKILPADDEDKTDSDISYYNKECLVSEWSSWGECSKTCGYGVKVRTRNIVRWTGNIPCPALKTEQLCGSMKQCNWSHFSLTFNSTKSLVSNPRRRSKQRTDSGEEMVDLTGRRAGRRGRLRKQPATSPST